MINIALVEEPVNTKDFSHFNESLPTLFLGFAIKNEYDNRRLKINNIYSPKKQLFLFEKEKEEFNILPLYGLFLKLNDLGEKLATTLLNQDLSNKITYPHYEKILSEYDLTCNNSYSYLNKRIYPIDFNCFSKVCNDKITKDKKILQHLLYLDDDKFDFQKFGAFKLLILA